MCASLVLGTVQLGMPYGVANRTGQVEHSEAISILKLARDAGINMLDTAVGYRDSEQRLGEVGVQGWDVVTKLPPLPEGCTDVAAWVRGMVDGSTQRLGVSVLYGLLLHRSQDLVGTRGAAIHAELSALKAAGRVRKIGVSIYNPEELEILSHRFVLDLVQAPFNVLDRRILHSGWLVRLRQMGTEVHVRSIFLQGLLLMRASERPARFAAWRSLWATWDEWLAAQSLTPLQACIAFASLQQDVDGVVIGVDSVRQLAEILSVGGAASVAPPAELSSEDPRLINPSLWGAP